MTSRLRKLRFLLSRREQRQTLALLPLLVAGAALELVSVSAIPVFVSLLSRPRELLQHLPPALGARLALRTTDSRFILYAAAGLLAISVVKNVSLALTAWLQNRYLFGCQAALASRVLRAYLRAPYAFHLQRNTADMLRNAHEGALEVISAGVLPVFTLVLEGLTIAAITGLLVTREPLITFVTFGMLGTVTVAFMRTLRGQMAARGEDMHRRRTSMIRVVHEGLGGIKITRVLGRERHFHRAFEEGVYGYARSASFRATTSELPRLLLETTAILGLLVVAAILVGQGRPANELVPTLTLFGVAIVRMVPSFNRVTGAVSTLRYGRHALDALYDDLRLLDADVREPVLEIPAREVGFTREIEFRNVTFQYPSAPVASLADVSIRIPKGAAIGIVGPTGSGKTTLVDLMLGLHQPSSGQILVDGVDIRDGVRSWQNLVGYVPQDTYLTDDTIRRNIALGLRDGEIDDEAVTRAVEAAQLTDFVASLPDGLETVVGERGVRLSGGQRQRVGIARALYANPQVLIMDEATSSLDTQTERFIMQAVESLSRSRTVILVAHRMTTVRKCDVLVLLADGGVSCTGKYEELVERSQRFRRMVAVDDREGTRAAAGLRA